MITRPRTFKEAIEFILGKDAIPSDEWDADLWRGEEREVATRAFFASRVENARFLDRAQAFLFDTMAGTTEEVTGPDGVKRTALRGGDRATFVRRMREFMIREGMVSGEEEFFQVNQRDVRDIRSERRLRLIYDTNMRQAYGYGQWKQGQTPAILRRFPAQRFVRDREVFVERPRHTKHEGDVRLKSDEEYWADYQNDPSIGGFGVPWPPFGFGSGMGVRDVSREEAQKLGLEVDDPKPSTEKSLNTGLAASVKKMNPEVKKKLVAELRGYGIKVKDGQGEIGADSVNETGSVISEITPKLRTASGVSKRAEAAKERALQAIEKIHGDGPLEEIPFKQTRRGSANASYNPYADTRGIILKKINGGEVSVVHEIGHWLDHEAFYIGTSAKKSLPPVRTQGQMFREIEKTFGSYGPEFEEFRDAFKASASYAKIENAAMSSSSKDYLLSSHEGFARAYSQWIAQQSGDKGMIKEIEDSLGNYYGQWEWDDFSLISVAISNIFKRRGWLKNP